MGIIVDNQCLHDTLINELPSLNKELKGLNISAQLGNRLSVSKQGKNVNITYTADNEFFRALSHLRGIDYTLDLDISEQKSFGLLSFMLDCSRNAVMNYESYKELIALLAMMGYNSIMLYTEDTYEIPQQPYFGHLRGRFTAEELKRMDNYAAQFGIEMIPCIQTLAHLNAMFAWRAFAPVRDVNDILLCDDDKTYELIDNMFESIAANFTTRRVNIGMDEAHLVGLGRYLDLNGYKNRTEIMTRHLAKVLEIAEKYGFRCCMWSDMFFRLAYQGNYYPSAEEPRLDKSVLELVPKNVELIYWDYYHTKVEEYDNLFSRHFDFDNNIIFAGGAWRWSGLTPLNRFGLERVIPGIISARKNKIQEVIVTCWGDNGSETAFFAALPQVLTYAEYNYQENPDSDYLEKRMRQTCDAGFEDMLTLDIASYPYENDGKNLLGSSFSKNMLYNDPLLGMLDCSAYDNIGRDYAAAADKLKDASKRNPRWQYIFDTQAKLCSLLSTKTDLILKLKSAYDTADTIALSKIADEILPLAIKQAQAFLDAFRKQWYRESKTFGFEVIQIRVGGVKERLNEAKKRLKEYLSGKIDRIEELEQPRLPIDPNGPYIGERPSLNVYTLTATASPI